MFKNKSFLDLFWSFADNISQQLINFIVGIILARLLLPQEFGLIGIITVFITISNVFVDGGFSSALINKKQVTNIDYNTVFYTNIGISSFLYLLIFLLADLIAEFFNNPDISNLLRIAGLNIVLLSFGAIHRTIIIRKLNFRLITIISLIAVSISAVCAIFMAYHGFGVYSLVYRVIIGQLVTVFLFWILNDWKPTLNFSKKSFYEMFNYGSKLMISNLLNTLHSNVYYLLIGKFFSPAQLGYYTRANTFRDLASTNISNTIKRVSFSTLSKITDEEIQLKKFYFFNQVTYLLTSFAMLVLFFLSHEIILILLSEKWLKSVEILQIIAVSGVFLALYNLNLDYLAVLGKTKLYLTIEIIGKFLVVPIIFIGLIYGFKLFLYAIILQNFIMYFIVSYNLNKLKKGVLKFQLQMLIKFIILLSILFIIIYFYSFNFNYLYIDALIKFLIVICLYVVFNANQIYQLKKNK